MLNSLINGICEKLNSTFGDEYKIYTESVKQGLSEPCFFVQLISPTNTQQRGNWYLRENLFCIQYFPLDMGEPKAECYQIQEALYIALEYVTVDGNLLRGVGMRGEFVDDVLNFFVNFNLYVKRQETITPMEQLERPDISTKG